MNIVCHWAQYRPNSEVLLVVEGGVKGVDLELRVRRKGTTVLLQTVVLKAPSATVSLGAFPDGGYEVELGTAVTAFDVARDPNRYLRYGFLSDFGPAEDHTASDVDQLLRYRINAVQFYDWMYRHHEFLPPKELFQDAMGRWVDLGVVRDKIALCHHRGQRAIAYGAVYGAEAEYIDPRPEQRLYRADGSPLVFINIISFCNIDPGNPWVANIVDQYRQTVERLDFDGIHMDQYGYPKVAFDHEGKPVDLESSFVSLIESTKGALNEVRADNTVFFNAVGDWPTARIAPSAVDAVYIEVWDPFSTYGHLMALVRRAKLFAPHKTVVLAAYLHCFNEEVPEDQKVWAGLTTQAFITAAGGTHLLWGEHCGALAEGYYVNHGLYDRSWEPLIRSYAEFPVKYRDWLLAEADDVSWDRAGGPNKEFLVDGWDVTPDGSQPGLTVSLRRVAGALVAQLLHPTAKSVPRWNEATAAPETLVNLSLRVVVDGRPREVWAASPDFDDGRLEAVPFGTEYQEEGIAVTIVLPRLKLWSMVVVNLAPAPTDRSVPPRG